MDELTWYSFPRNILPDVLLSAESPSSFGRQILGWPDSSSEDVLLGYSNEGASLKYYVPSLLILPERKSAEVLSWLKTYAPETSPLSQFGRVLSFSDFEVSKFGSLKGYKYSRSLGRWSSIVLGEILAQGDMESPISALPLSRSQATFSNAVARSVLCHTNDVITTDCVARLEQLELDRCFVSRSLSVKKLIPIWEAATETWVGEKNLSAFSDMFNSMLPTQADLFYQPSDTSSIRSYPELFSDSVESRVLAFRRLLSASDSVSEERASYVAANIAAGAFLVGRSTSHVFLLKEIGKKIPEVYAWFGLIAGIVGPRYWEMEWIRAAKGIEKSLRSKFSWGEPPSSDISWAEYSWMSRTYTKKNPFSDIPKQLPKVLSLEIVPGAICQFRLRQVVNATTDSGVNRDTDSVINREVDYQELNLLRTTLADFISLAEKARNISASNGIKASRVKNLDDALPQKSPRGGRRIKNTD